MEQATMPKLDDALSSIRRDLERVQHEIFAIGFVDDVFWQLAAIARENPAVEDPNDFLHWTFLTYVDSMAIRLRRLADRTKKSLSLWRVLEQLKGHGGELTRARFREECSPIVSRFADEWFDDLAGKGEDALPEKRISDQQRRLQDALRSVEKYADKFVAHTDLDGTSVAPPTLQEVRIGIIHALDVFNWCSLILNCCATISAVPKIQSNWLKVFRQPWLLQGREVPAYTDIDALAQEVHRS